MKHQRATVLCRLAGLVTGVLLAVTPAASSAEMMAHAIAATAGSVVVAAVGVSGPVQPGTDVVLHAEVQGITGIRSVRFFDGTKEIGVDKAAPWEFVVRGIVEGRHSYKAQVRVRGGENVNSATIEVIAASGPANQPPTVAILTPQNNASITLGTAIDLTADAHDADGSVARVEYWRGTSLLGMATGAPFKVTLAAPALGNHTVTARAFDNQGATGNSAPVAFAVVAPPPTASGPDDAVRLLLQATFGPSSADVTRVRQLGVNGWLDEQFGKPLTYSHLQYLRDVGQQTGMEAQEQHAYEAIWQNYLFGADQLRARVAFALSEIIVISNIAPDQNPWALASWMDMLYRNAFGNYRTLLGDATLHPAMGYYLNMLGNDRENLAEGYRPNENFARELEQLFSIGLVKLNLDGTPVKDAQGKTTPTYDQSVVEGFAQVFTGWSFAGNNTASDGDFYWPNENWIDPMAVWPAHHSPGTKKLLGGVVLPAGQPPQKDLKEALDLIFNHPNVGPFVSRRLIQFLVTSNPSPGYVARLAAVFNNNGSNVRGDLGAVVRAVLADTEARDLSLAAQPTYGKLREPVIRFTHLLRATGAKAANGRNSVWWLDSPEDGLGQSPLLAPSVFNFFSPFYTRPGAIAKAGLAAPEFQIHTETQVVGNANFLSNVLWNRGFGFEEVGRLAMDLTPWTSIAGNTATLVDQLNLVFTANSMSVATRATLTKAVNAIPSSDRTERVRAALTLLMVAPDFVVQH